MFVRRKKKYLTPLFLFRPVSTHEVLYSYYRVSTQKQGTSESGDSKRSRQQYELVPDPAKLLTEFVEIE